MTYQINQRMHSGHLEQMTCTDLAARVAKAGGPEVFMAGVRECWAVKLDHPARPVYEWRGDRFVAPANL